ncbi:MAG: LTA synthase family protein [Faecousia sp.]
MLVPLAFFLVELFAFLYLQPGNEALELWPLAFGALWAVFLGGLLGLLPGKVGRVVFGLLFAGILVYSVGQTGYYQLFSEMMWLSDFRYASEGADYWDVILSYPVSWFFWIAGLLTLGGALLWKYPVYPRRVPVRLAGLAIALAAAMWGTHLLQQIFEKDDDIQYAQSDYGRMQSAQAAYENMFNAHRLYQICGIYQTLAKDAARNLLSLGTEMAQEETRETIGEFLEEETQPSAVGNEMTGILKDKNVILVLMESVDDWMIGDHTPTIKKLMSEGINFTNFYTPPYGGIRTFNTEFCVNTGSFLNSQGGYAFDYVTNAYNQSLASLLREEGYSAKTFHYNDPSFYSRGVFSEAMGYEEYVYYGDYLTQYTEKERKQLLYDDKLVFTESGLRQEFFREGKTLNFLITRSAHLSYKYNEVLSNWGLKKYPEYLGMTGHEETDCAMLKARLVDDMFQWLMMCLEEEGRLQDTVIIGVTDHYTYGYKDEAELMKLSGVEHKLLLEKTPCFIWSADLAPTEVDKTLNTADLLPTLLNMLDIDAGYGYLGQDAFDHGYEGYAIFSDGSWIVDHAAYDASCGKMLELSEDTVPVSDEFRQKMDTLAEEYVAINNLILQSDYYKE